MKKLLAVGVIVLFLGLAIAPSINALEKKPIECQPNRFPFIQYPVGTYVRIENISNLTSPIPPGEWISIPLIIEYWASIPQYLKSIPWPLNTLWLFFSFRLPMQEICLETTEVSAHIDIVFSDNPVFTPFIYNDESTNISVSMYICVGEDTPVGVYTMSFYSNCTGVGRIKGDESIRTVTFEVGYE